MEFSRGGQAVVRHLNVPTDPLSKGGDAQTVLGRIRSRHAGAPRASVLPNSDDFCESRALFTEVGGR